MPRGMNPNSKKNLIQFSGRSRKEIESLQKAAGEKSGRSRQKMKSIKECLKKQLTAEQIEKMNEQLIKMAIHGNLKAYALILKLLGEDPAKKIEMSGKDGEPQQVEYILHWGADPYDPQNHDPMYAGKRPDGEVKGE